VALPARSRPAGRAESHPQDVHFPPVSRVVSAGFGERGGGDLRAGAPMG